MSYEACPNPREDCPLYNRLPPEPLRDKQEHGCYSDEDHIVPRFLIQTAENTVLAGLYIMKHPENTQQICRWRHNQKTAHEMSHPPELPSAEYMRNALWKAIESGIISLSKNKTKRAGLE